MLKVRDFMGQELHDAFNDIWNDFTNMRPHAQADTFFSEYLSFFFPRWSKPPPPPKKNFKAMARCLAL